MQNISLENFRIEVEKYLALLDRKLSTGIAQEHAHRAALQILLESFNPAVNAINDAKQSEIGRPDFVVQDGLFPKGYVEAKDIDADLDKFQDSEQFERYLGLQNLITTDYLEFRWFILKEERSRVRIGSVNAKGRIESDEMQFDVLYGLFERFYSRPVPAVRSPKELATRMGDLAKNIVPVINQALKKEGEYLSLHQKFKGFQDVLLHDLTIEEFADMYGQTIVYGFFAARCNHKTEVPFSRQMAASEVPKTNPFLRWMFQTFSDEDDTLAKEGIDWLINDLVDLLSEAKIKEILRDFGTQTQRHDPVVHFYETFLAEYNPKLREKRGVYYTPEPVVSYIVRSVDFLLKSEFDIADGLASREKIKIKRGGIVQDVHKVLVLDPATGTGTFLHEVIAHIHKSKFQDNTGLWQSYVPNHLLPRLIGFEILMAPYAIAHLKLGLQLQGLNYNFASDERLRVYLTNTLEEASQEVNTLFAQRLSEEVNAAGDLKLNKPVMVILGNPPYFGISANASYRMILDPKTQKMKKTSTWIGELLKDYYQVDGKSIGERNPKWLQDDYVKFFRFAQEKIGSTGYGIVAMITNNGFLDNPTFRGMRQSLMKSFEEIYVLDLHGNSKKKEKPPKGGKDENVFEITQGVSITVCIQKAKAHKSTRVYHADIWGKRESKFEYLSKNDLESTKWKRHTPAAPLYLFAPQDMRLETEYLSYFPVREAMPVNVLGFQSHRDQFAIDFDKENLLSRFSQFRSDILDNRQIGKLFDVADNRDWKIAKVREAIRSDKEWKDTALQVLYRPFDVRWAYYSDVAMDYPRKELLDHVAWHDNLCLNLTRQTKLPEWRNAIVTDAPTPAVFVEIKDGSNVFPLWLYKSDVEHNLFTGGEQKRVPNFSKEFLESLESKLGVKVGEGRGKDIVSPEAILGYIYAIFYSATYRSRYLNFLKSEFPRIPITSNIKLFKLLSSIGQKLIESHTLQKKSKSVAKFRIEGTNEVKRIGYDPTDHRVYINETQYFEGVTPAVWEFKMGGYQVAEKWLKDRKGRVLSFDDGQNYIDALSAMSETIRLMSEIDCTFEAHGGWPLK